MAETTTIEIKKETWRRLNSRKYPGDTFDDVVDRVLDELEAYEEGTATPSPETTGERAEEPQQQEPVAVLDEEGFEEPDGADADVEAFLDDVQFPTSKNRDDCVAVVRAAYEYLKEHRKVTKKEFVRELMPDHSLGYDVEGALEKIEAGDRYRGGWWRSVVAPGLESHPDVEKPGGGASEWTYTGE